VAINRILSRSRATILSPLRYPGAKRRLAGYIAKTLALNGLRPSVFVEPFAGGASVALQLLSDGAVERIGLVDRDPLISSFWKTVFWDSEWLCDQVAGIDITLENWSRFRRSRAQSDRGRSIACLFLNRTSFSGILAESAGPLGGWDQAGTYDLACRFPRETLIKRIKQAAALRDRVAFVWNETWRQALSRIERSSFRSDCAYYVDPPFFRKAERLYRYWFEKRDHERLRDTLIHMTAPWILSYDSAGEVEDLYGKLERRPTQVEMLYSASGSSGLSMAREVVLTNLNLLPVEDVLWRNSKDWRRSKTRDVVRAERGFSRRTGTEAR